MCADLLCARLVQVLELLKQTGADSKNMFGQYTYLLNAIRHGGPRRVGQ